jgi:hypothetical protein
MGTPHKEARRLTLPGRKRTISGRKLIMIVHCENNHDHLLIRIYTDKSLKSYTSRSARRRRPFAKGGLTGKGDRVSLRGGELG